MGSYFKRVVLICSLLLVPVFAGAQAPDQELLIGLHPEINVLKQMGRYQHLADYLSRQTGMRIRFEIIGQYRDFVDSFSEEKVDGAFFGSFTGMMAIKKLGVIPLARPVNLDGESTYHGYIFARKESGIKGVSDMKGKKFAFVDKATTAGYFFPLAYLKEQGITDIDDFLGSYNFEGRHDAAVKAVLYNMADVGAAKNTVFEKERQKNSRVTEDLVVLAESSKVPSNGLCVRKDLDPQIAKKLQHTLLMMDQNPGGRAVLEKFGALGFVETSARNYEPVLDLVKKAGLDLD